jgi:hypothetical protein
MKNIAENKSRYARLILGFLIGVAVTLLGTARPALAQTSVTTCGPISASGGYQLTQDLISLSATCIQITASNVTLFLNQHTIQCAGGGFLLSCQQFGPGPIGIDIGSGLTNVAVMGPGVVTGFDTGIRVSGSNALIKRVDVSGPMCLSPFTCARPDSVGIEVNGQSGVNLLQNSVHNYSDGIHLDDVKCPGGSASCVLNGNAAFNNFSLPIPCHGITLNGTTGYTLTRNVAHNNGENGFENAGIYIVNGSTGNTITNNNSSNNLGFGIAASMPGASGNIFVNNVALGNTFIPGVYGDLGEVDGAGPNTWNNNNTCNTQVGTVPPGVCGPTEM